MKTPNPFRLSCSFNTLNPIEQKLLNWILLVGPRLDFFVTGMGIPFPFRGLDPTFFLISIPF
jgi:hypothetical protein